MHFEKRQRGLLREAFRGEGEGANGCKCWGENLEKKTYAVGYTAFIFIYQEPCSVHLIFQDRSYPFPPQRLQPLTQSLPQ